MIELPKIILASASPRRAEILRTVGWPFEALPVQIDESRRAAEDAAGYVQRLAREKAEAAAAQVREMTIVAADTTVVIDDHILEKPADHDDAMRMLRLLNNRWHEVLTGVAVIDRATLQTRNAHERTAVKFAAMSDEDIEWYVAMGEPMDKAGAYAIQGLGARFIEGIKGDYFNVVGLPVRLLYELIDRRGAADRS
jgi:septum formation protein